MEQEIFDRMLAQVAAAYDTTPADIHVRIMCAISEGQQSCDPQVSALWASIPRTGDALTPEDFVEYLARTLQKPFAP